jgi:hypothetical protein
MRLSYRLLGLSLFAVPAYVGCATSERIGPVGLGDSGSGDIGGQTLPTGTGGGVANGGFTSTGGQAATGGVTETGGATGSGGVLGGGGAQSWRLCDRRGGRKWWNAGRKCGRVVEFVCERVAEDMQRRMRHTEPECRVRSHVVHALPRGAHERLLAVRQWRVQFRLLLGLRAERLELCDAADVHRRRPERQRDRRRSRGRRAVLGMPDGRRVQSE